MMQLGTPELERTHVAGLVNVTDIDRQCLSQPCWADVSRDGIEHSFVHSLELPV